MAASTNTSGTPARQPTATGSISSQARALPVLSSARLDQLNALALHFVMAAAVATIVYCMLAVFGLVGHGGHASPRAPGAHSPAQCPAAHSAWSYDPCALKQDVRALVSFVLGAMATYCARQEGCGTNAARSASKRLEAISTML
mmetsp:Transcript_98836/g.283975  ORF Transcript_98836/g.283975 Transcript_98836/m.283975 type:complete len:144 (-) Transcript_98836:85-516(-)